jgi:acyl-CoA thioester hydrolase
MEQAKGAFLRDVVGVPLDEANTVVRSLDVEYERSIESGQEVTVELRVENVGETSFTIAYRLNADGEEVASARTVSILLDEAGTPRAIPDDWRRRIEEYDRGGRS